MDMVVIRHCPHHHSRLVRVLQGRVLGCLEVQGDGGSRQQKKQRRAVEQEKCELSDGIPDKRRNLHRHVVLICLQTAARRDRYCALLYSRRRHQYDCTAVAQL